MGVETPRPVRDPNYYWREASLITPTWEGNASKVAGLHGQAVDQSTFLNLHDGYTTKDGERDLKLPRYMKADRRGSFDVTVNLPKCASILNEVGGDSRIGDVLTDSTSAVMEEIERQAYTRHPWEQNNNLFMTRFRHPGSRAGDPHPHDHIWFANLSLSSKGWKAVELGKNLDWERIGEISRDTQMKGLRQLGYKVRREGKEYEIVGVPAEVKAKFSRRHGEIKEMEAGYEQLKGQPLTSKAKAKLSVYDRPEKEEKPVEERREEWRSQLTDSEHSIVAGIVKRARATANLERWREESRSAFDRRRPMTIEQPVERERSLGRGR